MDWVSGTDSYQTNGDKFPVNGEISFWPTSTAGNGKYKKNNLKTGSAQGIGSLKRKVGCKQCGFVFDASKVAHDGGSLNGNGAGGIITTGTVTYPVGRDTTETDVYGDQVYNLNAGCPLCFSRNGVSEKEKQNDERVVQKSLNGF